MSFLFFILFFNGRHSRPGSSKLNGPIFTKISALIDGCKGFFTSLSFFRFLKERCHGNQLKSKKITFFHEPIYFVTLLFGNGLQYRKSDFKTFNRINFSTLCTILMAFGPENPKLTVLTIAPFTAIRQNRHITPNILESPGPILTYFTGLVGVLVGMIIQIFVWQSPKGRCHGNQLFFF